MAENTARHHWLPRRYWPHRQLHGPKAMREAYLVSGELPAKEGLFPNRQKQ